MLPDDPDDPDELPDPGLLMEPELSRSAGVWVVPLDVPVSWPGSCAVWQAGRGSLGRQSAGAWLDRPGLEDMDPDPEDDDPGLVVVPWFCSDGSWRSLGDTLWAITGVASRTAAAAAVSRRIMRLSLFLARSWRGHLWACPANRISPSRFAPAPTR